MSDAELDHENKKLREQILKLLRVEADLFRRNEQLDAQGKIYQALSDLGRKFNAGRRPEEIAADVVQFSLYSLNLERAVVLFRDGPRIRAAAWDGYYDEDLERAIAAISILPTDEMLDAGEGGSAVRIHPLARDPAERDAIGVAFGLDEYARIPFREDGEGAILGHLIAGNTARKAPHHGRIVADEPLALALQNLVDLASVALQTSRLHAALELERTELEARVEERTAELRDVNARLVVELGERQRADAERAALQEDMIRAQEERLLELSTPILPITRQVLVMPLIGTMDAARADQVLYAALDGASRRRAKFVILDVTGVRVVDASFAGAIVRTVRALELLGVRAVVSGIQPEVAMALVNLGLDLEALVTKATLESGIAYAMDHCDRR